MSYGDGAYSDAGSLVRVTDVATEEPIRSFRTPRANGGILSPDGHYVVAQDTTTFDNDVFHIVDCETRAEVGKFSPSTTAVRYVNNLRFSPNGQQTIFTGSFDAGWGCAVGRTGGTAPDWIDSEEKLDNLLDSRAPKAVAVSNDGHLALLASYNRIVVCRPHSVFAELRGHTRSVKVVELNRRANRAISGGEDGSVFFWNLETGKFIHELTGHKSEVRCAAISPNGRLAATAGDDQKVILWNLESGSAEEVFLGHSDKVYCVTFSPDGKWLASGGRDNTVRLWQIRDEFWHEEPSDLSERRLASLVGDHVTVVLTSGTEVPNVLLKSTEKDSLGKMSAVTFQYRRGKEDVSRPVPLIEIKEIREAN